MNIQPINRGYDINFGVKGGNAKQNVLTKPLSEKAKNHIISTIQREYGEVIDPKFLRLDYVGISKGISIRPWHGAYCYLNKEGKEVKRIDYGENHLHAGDYFYVKTAYEFLPSGSQIRKWYDPETCQMCAVKYFTKYEPGKMISSLDFDIENGEVVK